MGSSIDGRWSFSSDFMTSWIPQRRRCAADDQMQILHAQPLPTLVSGQSIGLRNDASDDDAHVWIWESSRIDCLMNLLHSTFFTLRATLLQESKSSKWSARASAKTFKLLQVQDHPHVCHSPETYSATNVLHLNTWTAWFMQLCPLWCHVLIRRRLVNAFLDRFKIPMAKKEMHIRHCPLPASQYKKTILKVCMERNILFSEIGLRAWSWQGVHEHTAGPRCSPMWSKWCCSFPTSDPWHLKSI